MYVELGVETGHQLIATNNPTSFSILEALPAGVTLNTATGFITVDGSTVPDDYGSFTITATNSAGSDTKSKILRIGNVPVITSANEVTKVLGVAGSFQITTDLDARNDKPTHYGINNTSGAEGNFPIDDLTGIMSWDGLTGSVGVYPGRLFAQNYMGVGYQDPFTFNVQ